MKNILIIGAGRFGTYVAKKLHALGHQALVVDQEEERINQILPYVSDARIGNSVDESFMKTLGISNFDVCIVSIGDDILSSLETTSILEELGARKIVSRATCRRQEKLLFRSGADAVVFPERELGFQTAIRYSSDNISSYVELPDGYVIIELDVPERWDGKKVGELDIRGKFHINLLGIYHRGTPDAAGTRASHAAGSRPAQEMDMEVRSDTVLRRGERMLALGKQEHMRRFL